MSGPIFIAHLQTCLGRDDLNDVGALMEAAVQAPSEKKTEIGQKLLDWAALHVLSKLEEGDLSNILTWVPRLLGNEGFVPMARLCYHFGCLSQKSQYLQEALSYLDQAYQIEGGEFVHFHLWGNILTTLGRQMNDEQLIESGLDYYAKSFAKVGESSDLFWDWAIGWHHLYEMSHERSDLKEALDLFKRAEKKGASGPAFLIDYGSCYETEALASGNPGSLNKAMRMFRTASKEPSVERRALEALATGQYHLALLTDSQKEFERAIQLFEEVITACPSLSHLWLRWGELLLQTGWKRGQLKIVEEAIEKLTALKIAEVDPLEAAAALSHSLMALGVLIDDGRLIHEGSDRLAKLLESYPQTRTLLLVKAFSCYAKAVYFTDGKMFSEAVSHYSNLTESRGDDVEAWHGLFESYLIWSEITHNPILLEKAYQAALRLTELRPYSPYYQTRAAEVLLLHTRLEPMMKNRGLLIERAIELLQRSLAIREEFETSFQLARAWDLLGATKGDEGCFVKAVGLLEKLYAKMPTDIRLAGYLAIALMHLGECRHDPESIFRAETLFDKAIHQDGENSLLLERMGYCKLLLSVIASDPNHPEEGRGLRSGAEALFKKAALFGCYEAYYHLACLYSITHYFDLAIEYLKKAEAHDALPSIETLEHDHWLEKLREQDEFQIFLSDLKRG